ncbi:oxygen-dependent protoporphyrinogen oxidase [Agromyces terreus]|uniref:Coproporphyrinogen III oxidase n=1 Tax=Agromyces terreus TaxID=424795 RepID=A0A9X2GZJ0_9MICO|nr:protoporphyrinogen oxidase [Agromyces terreus]MCP2370213.1 oxygen-dependent protoporphyrinogen oxidase [Agromyces terreus]
MSEGVAAAPGGTESAGFGDSARHAGGRDAADGASATSPNRAATTTDVVVVGGGVAGLVAALECAKIGLAVTVLESREAPGGCVGRVTLGGLTLDSGAESFATRGGTVAELLDGLGLADAIEQPDPSGAWLVWPAGRSGRDGSPVDAAPLPRTGMLGIPANPLGDDVRRIIGWKGASRAYLDRLKPILRIGRAHSLGKLVRDRMGDLVLDRLVAPISSGVYSTNPDDLDLDVVAPGLNEAMTRTGSLSGGVGQLLEERRAGSAVQGLDGGMHRLVDALLAQLERFGADVVTQAPVTSLVRAEGDGGDAGWRATVSRDDEDDLVLDARFAIIAAPAVSARTLLAGALDGWADDFAEGPAEASVEVVILLLDAPVLDAAPRGTGVLVATDTPGITAKALTHSTAKWPWLARRTDGRHVVRLSYGRTGEPNPLAGLSDDEVREVALADASAALGVDLPAGALLEVGRASWRDALSQATIGRRDRVRALEEVLDAEDGLEVTGSWVAGTGLASVVPHAIEAAARIRHLAVAPRIDPGARPDPTAGNA